MEALKDGWVMNSGECFLTKGTRVDVKFRQGDIELDGNCTRWSWHYSENNDYSHDIVAWRLSEKVTTTLDKVADNVNNPPHYNSHPSGIQCIDVTRHFCFNLGNATKYIWRCDLKKDAIEDLRKAIFYLNDEIEMRLKAQKGT